MKRILAAIAMAAAVAAAGPASPAEKAIAAAQAAIAKTPDSARAYNALALGFARRARETADTAYYDRAEDAVHKSLEIASGNFEALRIRCWVLLGRHEFAQALGLATKLIEAAPRDPTVYGYLVDAHMELGNYQDAETAAQQMLDLSGSSIPAITRTAYLREVFGDIEGALELMRTAYERTHPTQTEDRAWMAVQIASLLTSTGRLDEAHAAAAGALKLFPDYHYALAALARVHSAQGQYSEAARLMQRRYQLAPHPENLFDAALAMKRAGLTAEARTAFAKFERLALAESERWDNANRELIAWYADHADRPAEALRIASREIARRHDVRTLDAYAWALHRSGRHREAADQIAKALAVGTIDSAILFRAGVIYKAVGDRPKSEACLRQSLETNPHSEFSAQARALLERK